MTPNVESTDTVETTDTNDIVLENLLIMLTFTPLMMLLRIMKSSMYVISQNLIS